MGAKSRIAISLVALLPVAHALAEDQPATCLPADLKLRVAFSAPERVMETLRALTQERGTAAKRDLLRKRFTEAGCASVDEQAARGVSKPNLICRIPGKSEATIAIGSSPAFDGWPATALLPEIARAVAASPREHGYAIALLSRDDPTNPDGARAFAKSGVRSPRVFVHLGRMGSGHPMLGPDTDEAQRCAFGAISEAVRGGSIESIASWGTRKFPNTCESELYSPVVVWPEALRRATACAGREFEQFLDTDPFVRKKVPIVGVYDFPEAEERSQPDPAAYFTEYRVIAAYAVALDQLLATRHFGAE